MEASISQTDSDFDVILLGASIDQSLVYSDKGAIEVIGLDQILGTSKITTACRVIFD